MSLRKLKSDAAVDGVLPEPLGDIISDIIDPRLGVNNYETFELRQKFRSMCRYICLQLSGIR